jgi:hypothetical protein
MLPFRTFTLWNHHKHLRRAGFDTGAAIKGVLAAIHLDAEPSRLGMPSLPTKIPLPAFQSNGIFLANTPAYPTAIAEVWIDKAFILRSAVAYRAKRAISPAELATCAGIPVDTGYIFRREKDLNHPCANLHSIGHAVLITIAQPANKRRVESPNRVYQSLLV